MGYSLKNNNKIDPSILINQLLNYITSNFYFTKCYNLKNNKEKISESICKKHKKEDFYEKKQIEKINFNKIQKTKKINKEIYNKIFSVQDSTNLDSIKINLKNIISFWKNPIRYFFNYTLNIKLRKLEKNIITEPFSINKLDDFKISHIIFKKMLKNENTIDTFKKIILSGILPYGYFGSLLLKEKKKEIEILIKQISKYRILPKKEIFDIKIEKYNINGCLDEIQSTGLLRWKLGMINYRDRISLWLEHLIYCVLGGTGESKIIGYKKQIFSFCSLSSNIAYNYLLNYIEGYKKGIKSPLLLIKSGSNWFDKVYDKKNNCIHKDKNIKRKAYKILHQTWIGNEYISGEKEDLYIQQIISKLNVKKICKISKKWLTPILKNQKK
ncbi:hypothetical protein [uncultured Buchnera sp.]|uniref:hypothetical protein n=1 Tax=uncultured Buchnera sp. TaxID=574037 RepID=UPI003456871B